MLVETMLVATLTAGPVPAQGQDLAEQQARGFARLRELFHRRYGDDLAVYRCDTNRYGEVMIYFLA